MLRFVVLINCATLLSDRAQGLRRIAELVANVMPDFGIRRLGRRELGQSTLHATLDLLSFAEGTILMQQISSSRTWRQA